MRFFHIKLIYVTLTSSHCRLSEDPILAAQYPDIIQEFDQKWTSARADIEKAFVSGIQWLLFIHIFTYSHTHKCTRKYTHTHTHTRNMWKLNSIIGGAGHVAASHAPPAAKPVPAAAPNVVSQRDPSVEGALQRLFAEYGNVDVSEG